MGPMPVVVVDPIDEVVINYNSGQVDAFEFRGVHLAEMEALRGRDILALFTSEWL